MDQNKPLPLDDDMVDSIGGEVKDVQMAGPTQARKQACTAIKGKLILADYSFFLIKEEYLKAWKKSKARQMGQPCYSWKDYCLSACTEQVLL